MKFGKKDVGILVGIVAIFLLITLPGIDWGAPAIWNPDEIIRYVAFSFDKNPAFNTSNLAYPALPLYTMSFIAKLIAGLGKGSYAIIVGIRAFSVFLGLIILILTYLFSTHLTSNRWFGLASSFFILTNNEYLINSRFAHNDIYMMFFAVLSVYSLILFKNTNKKRWLYGSFLLIGFAVGSKYNAGGLILAPIIIYLIQFFSLKTKKYVMLFSELLLGGFFSFIGYFISNPFMLNDPIVYVTKLLNILNFYVTYDKWPGDLIGFWGQWSVLSRLTFGKIFFIFSILFMLFLFVRLILHTQKKWLWEERKKNAFLVILIALLVYDFSIMFSSNYQSRFFLFFVPVIALLFGIFLDEIHLLTKSRRWIFNSIIIFLIGAFIYSGLETASVILLFNNDSRIPASDFIFNQYPNNQELKIEYTLYPPRVDKSRFLRAHNYPLILIRSLDQELPISPYFEYNTGEVGIEDRKPDILVVDNKTYARFENERVCNLHLADCIFFKELLEGNTNYQLIKSFTYELPPYLPDLSVIFTNPDIFIFQRIP